MSSLIRPVLRALRHPWRTFKASVHYVAEHPPVAVGVALVSTVIAMSSLTAAIYFHSEDSAKFEAQKIARQEISQKVIPPFCNLIWTQVHPVKGTQITVRTIQNIKAYHALGDVFGCPQGVEPKA